jgi:hypothetical protein
MDWDQAQGNIKTNITIGTHLNILSKYRRVILADENGFIVSIGKNITIPVPLSMLKACFFPLNTTNGYDCKFFKGNFSEYYRNHGCYVQVIGQIFVAAGIAERIGRKYRLLPMDLLTMDEIKELTI